MNLYEAVNIFTLLCRDMSENGDFATEVLVYLATISNVWLISNLILTKNENNSGFLLLLHLAVADLIHDFHSLLFKWANFYSTEEFFFDKQPWILHNTFFGYVVSLVSFFAVIYTICREIRQSLGPKQEDLKLFREKSRILSEFGTSHGLFWTLAILLCLVIIFNGQNCDYLVDIPDTYALHPRNINTMPAYGVQCDLPPSKWVAVEMWKIALQGLSHPLWFPMLLFAFTPIIAFVLIGHEVRGNCWHQQQHNHRVLGTLLVTYFLLFFYDLIMFAIEPVETATFTLARNVEVTNQFGHQVTFLQINYVFHHWSRPLAAILRNAMSLTCISHSQGKLLP